MKTIPFLLAISGLCAVTSANASLSESLDRMSVEDPEFIAYSKLDGDFDAVARFLNDAYLAMLMSGQEMAPIPIDFSDLMNHLGLSDLEAVTAVSEPVEGGGFKNQFMLEFAEEPKGLMLLTGSENRPFTLLESAPADADLVAEFSLNGLAIYDIARSIVIDVMGPIGEGMIDAQVNQPLFGEGSLTIADLINRLTTQIQVVARPDMSSENEVPPGMEMFSGMVAVRVDDIADLFMETVPMLQQMGMVQPGPDGSTWIVPLGTPELPFTLHLDSIANSNDMLVTLNEASREWFLNPDAVMVDSEAFEEYMEWLPESGLSFWYTSERLAELQIEQLDAHLPATDELTPVMSALKSFMMSYIGVQSGVGFLEDNAYRVIAYQPGSYKTNFAFTGAVIPLSIAAAFSGSLEQVTNTQPDTTAPDDAGDPASGEVEPSPAD